MPALRRSDLPAEPLALFRRWLEEAGATGMRDPHAMILATASPEGRPSARTVLLNGLDERGFQFFTNYMSRKGRELDANPHGGLVFHWRELQRQVCVTGPVRRLSAQESDDYFASRPRESRIGAWASRQGAALAGREALVARVAEAVARFGGGDVPRPDFWGGFLLAPEAIEFWQAGDFRLHDRFVYARADDGGWSVTRLSP